MAKTVFWSWQSDLPSSVNKDFVKSALEIALKSLSAELKLEQASRIELDHDTKGEPGLVEIVATIFSKIEQCDVFVADVTPVSSINSPGGVKDIPNPNVMIELGYALSELGHQRVITVANMEFGGRPESLPFDLRHRRGAITYRLAEGDKVNLEKEKARLASQLKSALRVNLESERSDKRIKNPLPKLSLSMWDSDSEIFSIQREVDLTEIDSLDKKKNDYPFLSQADAPRFSTPFHALIYQGFGFDRQRKPFSEWTQKEIDGYNKRIEWYYSSYSKYLAEYEAHQLYLKRHIFVDVVLENTGMSPATDINLCMSFPEGVSAFEEDDLPSPPSAPSPPPFLPDGIDQMATGYAVPRSWDVKSTPRINEKRNTVVFRYPKLQHGSIVRIPRFELLFATNDDVKDFDVIYHLSCDNLPRRVEGKLHFTYRSED